MKSTVSNYSVVCAASRLMRLAMHRPSYDPVSAPKPNVKVYVDEAKRQLEQQEEQDKPVVIDCGQF